MNIPLWVLQVLAALLYGASGAPSSLAGARHARTVYTVGLIVPCRLPLAPGAHGGGRDGPDDQEPCVRPGHAKYGEITAIILSSALDLLMAFIAYGRIFLKPIS